MARMTERAFNRKYLAGNNRDAVKNPAPIPPTYKKVGECALWEKTGCERDIFAAPGQLVRVGVHKRCQQMMKGRVRVKIKA